MLSFTVYDIFKRNAAIYAKETAVVCGEKRFTFEEVLGQVDALANGFKKCKIGKGDRIAILAYNCHQYLLLFGAAAARGAVVVAINWRLSADEISHIIEDCAPSALFYDKNNAEVVNNLTKTGAFSGQLFTFDSSDTAGIPLGQLALTDSVQSDSDVSSDDPFCIIYTAAVGGKSRGAVLTHANLVLGNLQSIATMGLSFRDVNLNMLPLFHITGINLAFSVMHAGGKNVIMEKFDPQKALEWIEKDGVSVIGSFPPILSNLQAAIEKKSYSTSTLRHILGIDSIDNIKAFEARTSSIFWTLYGQTETSGMVSFSPAREKFGSAGKQGLLMKMNLIDENEKPVPVGETGEIVVQGPLVFKGFWNQEEYNKYIFRNGWHHTGDLGRLDEDGYLWFAGRKPEKDLIKPGGENVYPAEVEKTILEHNDVLDVSVIGVPDPKFGEGIKAVCVLKPGSNLKAEELKEFVASRIARYKKPGYVEFVESLPKTTSGVIDRLKVKLMYG